MQRSIEAGERITLEQVDCVIDGSVLYAATSTGLQIFDVSDPADVTRLGRYDTPDEARAVHVEGNVAYVAANTAGLEILDVSNPAEITRLGTLLDSKGVSVQFHAIGDQSIEHVIEALEAAAAANGGKLNTRHYPDHMGFITPDQIKRIVDLTGLIGFAPFFVIPISLGHHTLLRFVSKKTGGDIRSLRFDRAREVCRLHRSRSQPPVNPSG